jgi:long-chain acyl-CoA synthetase
MVRPQMYIDFMLNVFSEYKNNDAIIWNDKIFKYDWLLNRFNYWRDIIEAEGIKSGSVVILEADFSPNSISLFLALVDRGCILVPLTDSVKSKKTEFIEIAQGEVTIVFDKDDKFEIKKLPYTANHAFYLKLRETKSPGLVLFSSGSTGKNKAAVHDLTGILEKFKTHRHSMKSITFLLYDHIGGVNTMFYVLSNAGCIVTVTDRSPDGIFRLVEKYKVEMLPASPTFFNLVLMSEAYKKYDISSLKLMTYGTETMMESTLKRFHELFPNIRLQQTYGLSEVGILRSKSKDSDSLWVKVGGEGFETRIVDGILHIKAKSAMLGYLNAPSPFTEDGWFNTNDVVETDGEFIKILGRASKIINVGGEKVYPTEVENVIQEIDNVAEVTVYGEKNPIVGNIVCAKITLKQPEDSGQLIARLKTYCRSRLQNFKVPIKIQIIDAKQYSERYKKIRFSGPE